MTEAKLAGHARAIAGVAEDWRARAATAISDAVDRAHAHSVVALTETLRKTPDGRRTLRKASQSRSYIAALADLDGLLTTLAGPSVASLDGMLRDAREATYRTAFGSWVTLFPEPYTMGEDAVPTQSRIADVRGLLLHGMELRREVGAPIDAARRSLLANLEMSARKADPRSTGRLDGWKVQSAEAIARSATTAIWDAAVAIDSLAGVDAVKPEYRPKNRYTPG